MCTGTTKRSGWRRASEVAALGALMAIGVARWPARLAAAFETKTASFAIAFRGDVSAYRDMSAFVLPGATVIFEAVNGPPGDYDLKASHGAVNRPAPRKWRWIAPDNPGLYELRFDGPSHAGTIDLHVFVIVP